MKQNWKKFLVWFDSLSMRERMFVSGGSIIVMIMLFDTFLIEPQLIRRKALNSQLVQQQQTVSAVKAQADSLQQESLPDSKSPRRLQLEQLQKQLAEGNAFLQSSRERLVEPHKMASHLRQILNRNHGLKLVSLKTLPVSPLLEQDEQGETEAGKKSTKAAAGNDRRVFKHGVQLTVQGSYLDILNYLNMLESLPQQLYWARARMEVVKYPVTEMTLVLYTLSLDRTWLKI